MTSTSGRKNLLRAKSALLIVLLMFDCVWRAQAGDILRGGAIGGSTGHQSNNPSGAGSLAPPVPTAQDVLARTSQAVQSMRAMQQAARNAALNGPSNLGVNPFRPGQQLPNVPNGLIPGGLQVAPGVPRNLSAPMAGEDPTLWQGATLPQETTANGQTTVTITQHAQQAILNWETFNIGRETRLTFDQSAGGANATQWIAFNIIRDPSGNPSQILGSLDAIGQVFVINQNGILFGGSSQVNLHTLVASALPINSNLIERGLLNNPDNQFLFSALALPAGQNGTPAFDPPTPLTPDGRTGDVIVQRGAQISAPTSPDHVGGRVMLIGANATNDGTISTPDGQTIIAAGLQLGVAAHPSSDPSLRGLDVYVGAINDPNFPGTHYAGTATNSGLIDALRADVTIAGSAVNQRGVINSSTSVSLNGRIDLLANYDAISNTNTLQEDPAPFLFQSTGLVTLGPGSVTQILPELESAERAVGLQLALPSQINVQGLAIHLDDNAITLAPSATVTMEAGTWHILGSGSNVASSFVFSEGQIYLDAGAIIDVSGSTDVHASVSENIIPAQLLGTELANSPLQHHGPLRGQTIHIDLRQIGIFHGQPWVGTPLADVSGYVNLVQRDVGELTTSGGTVNLRAGGSVVLQLGASINVSGGWINYEGAMVETTRLLSNGHLFEISQANPDRLYNGIYAGLSADHLRWGITETYLSQVVQGAHFESDYVQGGDGGAINITAPSMALDGQLLGLTYSGPHQRMTPPAQSALSLVFEGQDSNGPLFLPYSPTPPNVVFRSNESLPAADPFALDSSGHPLSLRADRLANVLLSPNLLGSDGFGVLEVTNSDGNITVPAEVSLATRPGGSITLAGANVDMEGRISAPGGSISLTAFELSPYVFARLVANPGTTPPPYDPTRGNVTLGPEASLSTAGLIIDDRLSSPTAGTLPLVTNGGLIEVESYNIDLAHGSNIDASGGVVVNELNEPKYGDGGNISLIAGQDPNAAAIFGGHLNLGGSLEAFSGAKAGGLTLQAPLVQIGGVASQPNTLLLTPEFFNVGGFGSFTINGLGGTTSEPDHYVPGVLVAAGTYIAPVAQSLLASTDPRSPITLTPTLLSEGFRTPISLTLNVRGVVDIFQSNLLVVRGDLMMENGSAITTDARGSVRLSGQTVAVLGSVTTPGGSITVSGANNSTTLFSDQQHPLPTVDIGPNAVLSAAGETLLLPDARGFRIGSVVSGGNITISGNIVAESGSILDVSGASGLLDLAPALSGQILSFSGSFAGSPLVPTRVESNGGSITFRGGQELFSDATLFGHSGGASALGGTLNLSSGHFFVPGGTTQATPLDVTMLVTQSGLTIPVPFYPADETAIGHVVLQLDGSAAPGFGHFAADSFNASGFDSLTLQGTVQFSGAVTLNANRALNIGNGGVILGDAAINLNAPYVAIGTEFQPPLLSEENPSAFTVGGEPFYFPPEYGTGILNVSAQLIDIGNLSLQNIGTVNLSALGGDVRGDGTFDVAGNINITAGQIYPPTETTFTIAAYDYTVVEDGALLPGTITFTGSGERPLPLSAGGVLNVYASTINQGGVLRAPIGTINLGWDGTGDGPRDSITNTALPIAQDVTLASGSLTSASAIDPITGQSLIIPYGINPNGTSWIDPAGNDITAGGGPEKTINIAAVNVHDEPGSTVDIRGGGDLYAYQFVPGIGGTNDVINSSTMFAVILGYDLGYAPFAPFNPSASNGAGYVNGNVAVGDRVHLDASSGLPEGIYTLLPAQYALLPGAFLIAPQSGAVPNGAALQPTGATVVLGYRISGLTADPSAAPLNSSFEIVPAEVLRERAQYNNFSANTFLLEGALEHDVAAPRLPIDSGHLVLDALQMMSIRGLLTAQATDGGRGGQVDISSPVDILIGNAGSSAPPGTLFLDAGQLSAFGAESLLIGGVRETTTDGTRVNVNTNNVTVNNAGEALTGSDIILVANENLTLAAGATIEQSGELAAPAETLLFGHSGVDGMPVDGSGNGVLLRVASDPAARIERTGVDTSTTPNEVIGRDVHLNGASVTLDSTASMTLDSSATVTGTAVNLDAGQISIQLPDGTVPPASTGLVLSGAALENLQAAQFLSLLSYSSIDIYGTGTIGRRNASGAPLSENFSLHAGSIRGFNDGGTAVIVAQNITLDNSANVSGLEASGEQNGTLQFEAVTIQLGENELHVDQFATLALNASNGILAGATGSLTTEGNLNITTPVITGMNGAEATITAKGAATIDSLGQSATSLLGGLGASIAIIGTSVTDNANILLPSGSLTLHATAGDVVIGNLRETRLDIGGTTQNLFDLVRFTNGGEINLIADAGSVLLGAEATVSVAAQPGGGDAGTLSVTVPGGAFNSLGRLDGSGGGTFVLDIQNLPTLAALDAMLNTSGFTYARSIRVRTGDVLLDGLAQAHIFNLSADQGSIDVTGTIDASGLHGGMINLEAFGNLTLESGALLTVAAQEFDRAGKGGAITLEAGAEVNGIVNNAALLDLRAGATLDLSVANNTSTSAANGNFTGTLHLRAPQTASGTEIQIAAIDSNIIDASSIVVEGYRLFDLTETGGIIDDAVQEAVRQNGETFLGVAGMPSPGYTLMLNRLLAHNQGLEGITVIEAGAEIINRSGDLQLGSASSGADQDWDLSTYRFGPLGAPGVLTLRASGNLVFFNTLSDGFDPTLSGNFDPDFQMWTAPLMAQNPLLPVNVQSWSFRLTSGADFTAADFHRVQSLEDLAPGTGSLLVGKNGGLSIVPPGGPGVITEDAVRGHFQVIRTGTGDIDISSGRDVQLLNQFATIYTAGTQVVDATMGGIFDVPILDASGGVNSLGAVLENPAYPAQYSLAGGNVTIMAQNDIIHLTLRNGALVPDSSRELPINWLFRRGFVDPATGLFGEAKFGDIASTTWWIDFSNFFEGVGTLGGGNVSLTAGHDVSNVDAVAATNARMPKGTPDAERMIELGGGDVSVHAGHDIDGGVYYVERGDGTLFAGNTIHTNDTRSPSLANISAPPDIYAPETWLPTTLFLGKGNFEVEAEGDLLLGPTANPFLLPEGYSNTFWYKTYFSTFAASDAVNVTSLTGDVTLREGVTLPSEGVSAAIPILEAWLQNVSLLVPNSQTVSFYQPWLRLDETNVAPFATLVSLMPPTLRVTALAGDVNIAGNITLTPSPTGTADIAAYGAINALQITGVTNVNGIVTNNWTPSTINVSDADPSALAGIISPLAYQTFVGTAPIAARTGSGFLTLIDSLFEESGSTEGVHAVLQNKQSLHAAGILHRDDADPLHLYASTGSISGLTLFSPKPARIFAGEDITDIAFYLQNVNEGDFSIVAAGRDLVAYDVNSPLRVMANSLGNSLGIGGGPLAGDIQVSGPGALEVLAGRNLDLGIGANNSDGTAVGITSIGNARNPSLPFAGADLVVGAGIGPANGLSDSSLDFAAFASKFLDPGSAGAHAERYLPALGGLLGLSGSDSGSIWDAYQNLPPEQQRTLALDIFYLVLRDSARDRRDPLSPDFGTYNAGFAAISALFPGNEWEGDISLTSREIKTANGGDINIFAPGGSLSVGLTLNGNQAVDQGVLTEAGGHISIFTRDNVNVGTSRIFTLRGGDEIIWSTLGDIAAGVASKTVLSAPPTRVLIDPQSGDVKTDLAGLATGGGIGVLESVTGVPPADVDLIAPNGTVDAGDAGIRVSGNLNISALVVLNAGNIQVGGSSAGVPVVSTPNLAGLSAASNATAATTNAASQVAGQNRSQAAPDEVPSIISVEVLGYGGGEGGDEEDQRKKRRRPEGNSTFR